jgi:hypothetical protein
MKKLLIFAVFLILASCEKEPAPVSDCWDCLIKQSNGIEYACKYECTEAQLQAIISDLKSKGTTINCEKRKP